MASFRENASRLILLIPGSIVIAGALSYTGPGPHYAGPGPTVYGTLPYHPGYTPDRTLLHAEASTRTGRVQDMAMRLNIEPFTHQGWTLQ